MNVAVIGGGFAGLSVAYHLGSATPCRVFERSNTIGGHAASKQRGGFTWDEGPHLSFTKNDYVKELFAKSVHNDVLEYEVGITNHFYGDWIPHPAQSNLWAIPSQLKRDCLTDFLASRSPQAPAANENYYSWLLSAFGRTFAEEFPVRYTKKYWTVHPDRLSTRWIGSRIFYPSVEDVVQGAKGPLDRHTHYFRRVRYPRQGGFGQFCNELTRGVDVQFGKDVARIDLSDRVLYLADGTHQTYDTLVNTMPLPEFVAKSQLGGAAREAANALRCSSVLLVNVVADHPSTREERLIYVYDEDKYATRINATELLAPSNGLPGKTGIQVEVYYSKQRPLDRTDDEIADIVIDELVDMGLVQNRTSVNDVFTMRIPWANVIFDVDYEAALSTVLEQLERFGLQREHDDIDPLTDWDKKFGAAKNPGSLFLAGRYAQWKYFWTDDCVLRGKFVAETLKGA